jgi:hypothetical protein
MTSFLFTMIGIILSSLGAMGFALGNSEDKAKAIAFLIHGVLCLIIAIYSKLDSIHSTIKEFYGKQEKPTPESLHRKDTIPNV